jgi:conjugative relaxase-like TrwC/TraI family protein
VGYDLTLTTEKALSVLGLLSGDPTRRAVLDAIRVGNDRALDWLEHHAAITRVNGKPVPTTGWTVASFRHVTSRALDPFPHHHNVIANTVEDRTGARRTLDARGRYQHAQAASALATAEMRYQLARCLGVRWRPGRKAGWEIAGIPDPVLREFSQRRSEIDDALSELEGAIGHNPSLRELDGIVLKTRPAKQQVPVDELLDGWRTRAAALGLGPDELAACLDRARELQNPSPRRCTRRSPHPTGSAPTSRSQPGRRPHRARRPPGPPRRTRRSRCWSPPPGSSHWRTGFWPLVTWLPWPTAATPPARSSPFSSASWPGTVTACTAAPRLSPWRSSTEGSPDSQGSATSKATSCAPCAPAGIALSALSVGRQDHHHGRRPRRLAGRRLAGHRHSGQRRGRSNPGSGDRHATETLALAPRARRPSHRPPRRPHRPRRRRGLHRLGPRPRPIGMARRPDRRHPPPHRRSRPARCRRSRRHVPGPVPTPPTHTPELTASHRVRDPHDCAAADAIRAGDIAAALDYLDAAGHLHIVDDELDFYRQALTRWWAAHQAGLEHPIVDRRNTVRRQLNRLAHRLLQATGEIGRNEIPASGDRRFSVGDRVIARTPDRDLHPLGQPDAYVRNGALGTVLVLHPRDRPADDWITVAFDGIGTIDVPRGYFDQHRTAAKRRRRDIGLDHAYAVTSYAVQGATRAVSTAGSTPPPPEPRPTSTSHAARQTTTSTSPGPTTPSTAKPSPPSPRSPSMTPSLEGSPAPTESSPPGKSTKRRPIACCGAALTQSVSDAPSGRSPQHLVPVLVRARAEQAPAMQIDLSGLLEPLGTERGGDHDGRTTSHSHRR